MAIKVKSDTGPAVKSLQRIVTELTTKKILIGIFGKSGSKILMIARVHEYGVEIDVTPAMRGYLHSIGIHLNSKTTSIKIPERSFIRSGFDAQNKDYERFIDRLLPSVLNKDISVKQFFDTVGNYIVSQLQDYLTELSEPPLHPQTIANTNRSNPLVNSGNLRNSISFEVR